MLSDTEVTELLRQRQYINLLYFQLIDRAICIECGNKLKDTGETVGGRMILRCVGCHADHPGYLR